MNRWRRQRFEKYIAGTHPLPGRARGLPRKEGTRIKDPLREARINAKRERKGISKGRASYSLSTFVFWRGHRRGARHKISKIHVELSFVFSWLGFIRSEGRIYTGLGLIYRFRWHTRYRYTRISIRPLVEDEGSRKRGTWVYSLYAGVAKCRFLRLYCIYLRYSMPLLHLSLTVSDKRYIFNICAIWDRNRGKKNFKGMGDSINLRSSYMNPPFGTPTLFQDILFLLPSSRIRKEVRLRYQ